MISFPNCKINLGLQITRKRNDGYHDLETIFYPVSFCDGLEIIPHLGSTHTELSLSGLQIDSPIEDNICYKAYTILKKDHPTLPVLRMHLHKVIPTGAGLGGGSADGAFSLLLINKKFNLGLSEQQLIDYALKLGSDSPFFILNKPAFATGRGEKLEPVNLDLSNFKIVLINPGIHINTAWAFSMITPTFSSNSLKNSIELPPAEWKDHIHNDFEIPVFHQYPCIREIKEQLYDKGAIYASMSGSGSTVFGLFDKSTTPQFKLPSHYFMKSL